MRDIEKFIIDFEEFLKSEKKVVLIKGHDDNKKIKTVLQILNSRFQNGLICTSALGNVAELINNAFDRRILPKKINGKDMFKLGGMDVYFKKYYDSFVPFSLGKNNEYTLFYPVESALVKESYFKQLFDYIKVCESNKVIIVTTNDEFKNTSILEKYADETIYLEIKNDDPELYSVIQSNYPSLSRSLGKKPYYE